MLCRFVPTLLLLFLLFPTLFGTYAVAQSTAVTTGGTVSTYAGPLAPKASSMVSMSHAEEEKNVEFKSQTVLVQVPTVVTDKAGNHIHGLKKEDFKVEENGKEQKISGLARKSQPRMSG